MSDLSNIRTGRVTSSEIVALTSIGSRDMTAEEKEAHKKANPKSTARLIKHPDTPGSSFYTYVEDCRLERFYKMPLEGPADVFQFSWGKLCENIVHNKLDFSYIFQSDVTLQHPTIAEWVGTPDGLKGVKIIREESNFKILMARLVAEMKCPTSKKGFYNLIQDLYDFDGVNVTKKENIDGNAVIKAIRERSPEGEKYYQQIISNCCITGAEVAELIVFMPYWEELDEIIEYNDNLVDKYWNVARRRKEELPFIYKESGIENINIIRFDVPKEDKVFLTGRVEKCIELINA